MIRVLHVEDEHDDYLLICSKLQTIDENLVFHWAPSAEQGLKLMETDRFDCVLCDLQMPQMDGFEFVQKLRKRFDTTPVICLTGKGSEHAAVKAFRAGAEDYFVKDLSPVFYQQLAQRISRSVEGAKNISERAGMEIELVEREQQYRTLFENSKDAIFISTVDGRIFDANNAAFTLFGYKPEEINEIRLVELYEDPSSRQDYIRELLSSGFVIEFPARMKKRDGTTFEATLTANVQKDKDGKPEFITGIIRDVSGSASAKGFISRKNSFLTSVVESLHYPFYVINSSSYAVVLANEAARRLAKSDSSLCYKMIHGYDQPCDETIRPCTLKAVVQTGQAVRTENQYSDREGRLRQYEIHGFPVCDRNGNTPFVISYHIDITDKKLAERRLKESEQSFRSIFENVPVGIYRTTPAGEILMANPAMRKMLGFESLEELQQINLEDDSELYQNYSRKDFRNTLERDGEIRNLVSHMRHKDGFYLTVRESAKLVSSEKGEILYYEGVIEDLTQQEKAENALLESEKRARVLTDSAYDAIVIVDADGIVTYWNTAAARIFGYSREDAMGCDLHDLVVPERYTQAYREQFKSFRDTGKVLAVGGISEFKGMRKDGTEFPVELSLSAIQYKGQWQAVAMMRDVTQRKQMERQLTQAQKLEAIGMLAAGIAHEINTPTQYVGDNTRFLRDAFGDILGLMDKYVSYLKAGKGGSDTKALAEEIERMQQELDIDFLRSEIPDAVSQALEGVARVTRIVQAMKDFSHPGGTQKTMIDLNRAIESTITVTRNEWKYVSEMEKDLDPDLPPVTCMPNELNQVFLNIIVNAAQAISQSGDNGGAKGMIQISTRACDGFAEIRISDNGPGIPEENRERVFEPFFTTKEIGRGTGQGLAISHDVIVNKHGGTIDFESEVGKGTTFIIRLPLNSGAMAVGGVK